MHRFIRRRCLATRTWPRAIRETFGHEISTLEMHSTLLNQTSPSQLLELTDVRPMMNIFTSFIEQYPQTQPDIGPAELVVRKVVSALKQTAKDSSFALRALPQTERDQELNVLFGQLSSFLNTVSHSIVAKKVSADQKTIELLFSAYEIIDPQSGVQFFQNVGQKYVGAAIPCLVKSGMPVKDIAQAVHKECNGNLAMASRWTLAHLSWAYLKNDQPNTATRIFDVLMVEKETLPPSVLQFLLDAFIGDAPLDLALNAFIENMDHVPHHASMARFIARATKLGIDEQIALFINYIDRSSSPSELKIKTVSSQLVYNILDTSETPDEAVGYIKELSTAYDTRMKSHTILLNVILTEITTRWTQVDGARDLILAVLANYNQADRDVVSFRVRLNASSMLSDNRDIIADLWQQRNSFGMPRLEKLDWLALARGCYGSSQFFEYWEEAGKPFQKDVTMFCKSYGFI